MDELKKIKVPGVAMYNKIDKIRLINQLQTTLIKPYIYKQTGVMVPNPKIKEEDKNTFLIEDEKGEYNYRVQFAGDDVIYSVPVNPRDRDYFIGMIAGAVKTLLPIGSQLVKQVVPQYASQIDKVSGVLSGAASIAQGDYLGGISNLVGSVTGAKQNEAIPMPSQIPNIATNQITNAAIKLSEAYPEVLPALRGFKTEVDQIRVYAKEIEKVLGELTNTIRKNENVKQSLDKLSSFANALV